MSHIFINMSCFMPINDTYLSFLFSATNLQEKAYIEYRPTLTLPAMQETGFNLWVGKIPWRRERLPPQYSGLENSMDYGPWSRKESDTTEPLSLSLSTFKVTSAQTVRHY